VQFIATTIVVSVALLLTTVAVLMWSDKNHFTQPRAALEWSPAYLQVKADTERYCLNGCSQEQLDSFLEARDVALVSEWSQVLSVTLQDWRWRPHSFVEFSMGWRIRDDYRALIERVGGPDAAASCQPIVRWRISGVAVRDSFIGLRCQDTEFLLSY